MRLLQVVAILLLLSLAVCQCSRGEQHGDMGCAQAAHAQVEISREECSQVERSREKSSHVEIFRKGDSK